jgi:hypothetical protein
VGGSLYSWLEISINLHIYISPSFQLHRGVFLWSQLVVRAYCSPLTTRRYPAHLSRHLRNSFPVRGHKRSQLRNRSLNPSQRDLQYPHRPSFDYRSLPASSQRLATLNYHTRSCQRGSKLLVTVRTIRFSTQHLSRPPISALRPILTPSSPISSSLQHCNMLIPRWRYFAIGGGVLVGPNFTSPCYTIRNLLHQSVRAS